MSRLFNTIRDPRLRRVLESDYAELQLAFEHDMGKAALVLAGGIVEAVLINFLEAIGYEHPPKGTDPREMRLPDLISACEEEGALTPETASLCNLIKYYRNLIHPGRSVRNDELADQSRAAIVKHLVEHVVREVAERASMRPEWAAEAVRAVAMDEDLVQFQVAIPREIRRLPASEAARLVVEVLPNAYAVEMADRPDETDWMVTTQVTWACFRFGLSVVPTPVKVEAARRLMRELANDPGNCADWIAAFFTAELMAALDEHERADLFSFVLQCLDEMAGDGMEFNLDGVGPYLSASEARNLTWELARRVAGEDLENWATATLLSEMRLLPAESVEAARQEMDRAIGWRAHDGDAAARLSDLRYRIWPLEDSDIPR